MRDVVRHRLFDIRHPGSAFRLTPKQAEFVASRSFSTYLGGAWGSAKSAGLSAGLADAAMANPPGTDGMVVLPTYKMLKTFLRKTLIPMWGWARKGGLITGHNKDEMFLELVEGRSLYYRSGHDPEMLEGDNLCYIGLDEAGLMKRSIYRKAAARARDGRATKLRIMATGVPLWGWLYDHFNGRSDDQRRIITATIFDNPHLHPDYVKNQIDSCPARLAPCLLYGQFVPPGGTVYPEFKEDIHCWPFEFSDNVTDERGFNQPADCGIVVDPGGHCPHVLWVEILHKGRQLEGKIIRRRSAIVYDEIYPGKHDDTTITIERLCQMASAKGYPIRWIISDPAAKQTQTISGQNEAYFMRQMFGLTPKMQKDPSHRLIRNGVDMVKRMLAPMDGNPLLLFARSLLGNTHDRAVIPAIRTYHYPEWVEGRPISDDPIKDGITDHAMDCVRYLAINEFPVKRLAVRIYEGA
uniref:Putative terminase n=1 Tax=viral metagenome TaxID=1070528 RepID=A0A6H1ZG61_9ZZZZ